MKAERQSQKMLPSFAESTSEPEVAEPSFVPFRGAAKRLDGKAPSPSSGPPAPSTSAGTLHVHNSRDFLQFHTKNKAWHQA